MSDTVSVEEVRELLRGVLASALYCDPHEIEDNTDFQDAGLDSVLSAEVTEAVNAAYGLQEKAEMLYQNPTLEKLAAYVAAKTAVLAHAGN